jgi:hypothetical protein
VVVIKEEGSSLLLATTKIPYAHVSVIQVLNKVCFLYADVLPLQVSYRWLETQSAVCAGSSFPPDAN